MRPVNRFLTAYRRLRVARALGCTVHEAHLQAAFLPRLKAIYFTNPKVASTTIKATVFLAETGSTLPPDPGPPDHWDGEWSRKMGPEKDLKGFLRALQSPDYFRFAFVRNPYTRIVACYLDKIVRRPGPKYRTEAGLPAGGRASLAEFLRAIERQPPLAMNRHWRLQSVLIPRDVPLDFVGRFEQLEEDLVSLFTRLGLQRNAPIDSRQIHTTSAGARAEEFIGPKEKALIERIYAADFERFGYAMELPGGVATSYAMTQSGMKPTQIGNLIATISAPSHG
jgi:Sulfotransferase family